MNPLNMTFDEFKAIIEDGIAKKVIRSPRELTELDLAISYAIGKEQRERGAVGLVATSEDIANMIKKHCGTDTYNRIMSETE